MRYVAPVFILTLALSGCGKQEGVRAPTPPPAAPVASAPTPTPAVKPEAAGNNELKVGIDPSYEPFTFKGADGSYKGFDVDIASALCERIKRKCVFVESSWDAIIPNLLEKKYDVIISSLSITAERKQTIDFTDKYYNTPSRMVLFKGVSFTRPESLKNKRIGVLRDSTQEKYALGELAPAGVTVISYKETETIYKELLAGHLDGTVSDFYEVTKSFLEKPEAKDWRLAGPDLYIEKYFGTGIGVGLRKDNDKLKADLNAAIAAIRSDGSYQVINRKYFVFDVWGK